MYNQSFTAETFQEIFDKENRKGKNIEDRFKVDFEESLKALKFLKETNRELRLEDDFTKRIDLYEQKKELKNEREKLIRKALEDTATKVAKVRAIKLIKGKVYGKQSFSLENNIENFFISKKVQQNILKSYSVKQSNRYSLLSELINLLEDGFPKFVIRTDLRAFYESIPQKMLRDKINGDHLLNVKTKQFINIVLDSYNNLTNQDDLNQAKGVPRGVGFSSYLSELFMRKIDNKLKKLSDVVYYARYVDDIIIIFIPKSKGVSEQYLTQYKTNVMDVVKDESNGFLELNTKKTKEYNLLEGLETINLSNDTPYIIDYLGYKIGSLDNKLKTLLSDKKTKKYKDKIKVAFEDFKKKKRHNRKESFKLLKARLDYLTSNTKLRNNKDKVFVGVYYSNSFLNCDDSLLVLQKYLNWYIGRAGLTDKELSNLKNFDFVANFHSRKFQPFPIRKKLYKNCNDRDSDNKGVVQYGLTEINSIWKK
ncbi:antiviral reverse transcriptase Drt3a [Muricauda sp. ANG21]|uniref:antiviral reverse transcriptase Drt3a n=1 Tax=Allomuricauda sp. ANG21 TaxID=3042468 RepID=UPI003455B031